MRLVLEQFLAADDVDLVVKVIERKWGKKGSFHASGTILDLLRNFPAANGTRLSCSTDGVHVYAYTTEPNTFMETSQRLEIWNVTDGWVVATVKA
jgi:hypothetical protein